MKTLKTLFAILIIFFLFQNSSAQDWSLTGNALVGGEFLGSNGGPFPLVLKTTPAQPINFFTNNTLKMTLTSGGALGIGGPPNQLLTVTGGNINVTGGNQFGYMIGGFYVVRNGLNSDNIFL